MARHVKLCDVKENAFRQHFKYIDLDTTKCFTFHFALTKCKHQVSTVPGQLGTNFMTKKPDTDNMPPSITHQIIRSPLLT